METILWYKMKILVFDNIKDMRIYIINAFKSDEYLSFKYQGFINRDMIDGILFNYINNGLRSKLGIRKLKEEFPAENKYVIIKKTDYEDDGKYRNVKGRINVRSLRKNIKQNSNGTWQARMSLGEPPIIFYFTDNDYDSLIEQKRLFFEQNNIKYKDE